MKIYQYNQRIQYWYDRTARTWYCQENDTNGNLVDRADGMGGSMPAIDSYTKEDCIDNCKDLENELSTKLQCPHCKRIATVHHMEWSALGCGRFIEGKVKDGCGAMVDKKDWKQHSETLEIDPVTPLFFDLQQKGLGK